MLSSVHKYVKPKPISRLNKKLTQQHNWKKSSSSPRKASVSSAPIFPTFGLTAILKILSFRALALGDNIADLLQLWHQQPVLQIVTLAHSPACNSGSSAEMLCQSHWKTQIERLTKRRFVPFSVHRARVCIRGSRWDQCHVPP